MGIRDADKRSVVRGVQLPPPRATNKDLEERSRVVLPRVAELASKMTDQEILNFLKCEAHLARIAVSLETLVTVLKNRL